MIAAKQTQNTHMNIVVFVSIPSPGGVSAKNISYSCIGSKRSGKYCSGHTIV